MSSYDSESLFLSSLPKGVYHRHLNSLLSHCGQYKGREKVFHVAQNLLLNLGEFKGPEYEKLVKMCVDALRHLPDPEGHIKDYARHVEECCLSYWKLVGN
jgi:hypothetical protein